MQKSTVNTLAPTFTIPPSGKVVKVKRQPISVCELLRGHARCILTELLNLFFSHSWMYWLIGLVNKRLGLIESVFLVYPANEEYTTAFSYRYRARWHEWKPGPIGFFWQNGKVGVSFAISASDGKFSSPANKEKLENLVARMEEIRVLLGAKHKTFAGILPGVLFMRRLVRDTPEADITVKTVVQVINKVKLLENLSEDTPVIVLGGRGFIGRKVVASLPEDTVYSVDIASGSKQSCWPFHLQDKPVLLVNISLNFALSQYVHLMWPKMVVINEVYPEPSNELARDIRSVGCHCYHIVGVKAKALPPFPGGYEGGVPCCAAWQSEGLEALFKRIV